MSVVVRSELNFSYKIYEIYINIHVIFIIIFHIYIIILHAREIVH